MIPVPAAIRTYAKAVVTVAGFVVLVATQVATGTIDADVIITAGIGVLTTLGVIHATNSNPPTD